MTRRLGPTLLVCLLLVVAAAKAWAEPVYQPTLASLRTHPVPAWYEDGKFGIFIHWTAATIPAYATKGVPVIGYAEWYWFFQQQTLFPAWSYHKDKYGTGFLYDDFIPQWHAENFHADDWLDLFEEAGAKYFVFVTKHHDGLALFPTATTDRHTGIMGPGRNLVGELMDASRARGDVVKPGLYYSLPEFFNPAPNPSLSTNPLTAAIELMAFRGKAKNAYTGEPAPYTGYKPIADYAADHAIPQIRELIHQYSPYVLWCDIGGNQSYFRSNEWIAEFYNHAALTNPEGVVVNDRCGDQVLDLPTDTTHFDFQTKEYLPINLPQQRKWEATRGFGSSFGYTEQETDADWITTDEIVDSLVDIVSKNGNFLLNIGPMADGTVPAGQVERLRGVGKWLGINGEAIYGTRPWLLSEELNLRFTTKGDDFYVISTEWPGKQMTVLLPIPVPKGARMTLLGSDGQPLAYRRPLLGLGPLVITMPANGKQSAATTSKHAFVVKIEPGA